MKRIISIFALTIIASLVNHNHACTSIIVSGKATADGRPLMWKHRDTSSELNKLMYFSGDKYSYTGIVSVGKSELTDIWMGMNSAGLCIMNTASYNINFGKETGKGYSEGRVMAMALSSCKDIDDFEKMLNKIDRTGLAANFGVLDANGGAVYFEVGEDIVIKQDVNNPSLAPLGYMVKTNYSDNGDQVNGQGIARYITASNVFLRDAINGGISVSSILNNAERNLVNGFTGDDLRDLATAEGEKRMVHFKDNIARRSTTSSVIFKGIKPGEDPQSIIMWTVCGWPLATVAYPVWMNKDQMLPDLLTAPKGETSAICDAGLEAKRRAIPITLGHGQDYLDINTVYNRDGSGTLQWIMPLEKKVMEITKKHSSAWPERTPTIKELKELYGELDNLIIATYKENGLVLKK